MVFEPRDHGHEARLTGTEPDILHECANEIGRQRQRDGGRLIVDRSKGDRKYGSIRGRLSRVDIRKEVERPVGVALGEQIHARLALRNGKRRAIQLGEAGRENFEFFRPGQQRLHFLLATEQAELAERTGQ